MVNQQSEQRARWGSGLGFVLAATGSAVGLGAIWKFPYVAAHNGGGLFLLMYVALVLIVGLWLLRVEMAIGRSADASAYWAFRKLGGPRWGAVGGLAVISGLLILSFYSVVGGWTLAYFWHSLSSPTLNTATQWHNHFISFSGSGSAAFGFHGLFVLLTFLCVLSGVKQGIEALSKILMPCLFVMMVLLIVWGLLLPGAWEGVVQFIRPDWQKFNQQTLLEALGLSFWTLSLAMGIMVTYGSYSPEHENLRQISRSVVFLTLSSCVLAGLLVIPPALALGIDQGAGPGLTFVTMPLVFMDMPAGQWFGALFFALLCIAALTSAMSMFEVAVAFLIETLSWSRKQSAIAVGLFCYIAGIGASLSLGADSSLNWSGRSLFEWLDFVASHLLLPVVGVLTSLFAAWVVWSRLNVQWNAVSGSLVDKLYRFIVGVAIPAAIAWIAWNGISA